MKKAQIFSLVGVALLVTACNDIPRAAYFNHGTPESLLDVSSEVVTVQVVSDSSVSEAVGFIEQDQPSRAELYCADGDTYCAAVEEVLKAYGVEYERIASPESTLQLMYERVVARDCEHRYIDNHINPYNLNHPTYGCSVASNMVQMVSDKRQFTSPNLMDYQDAAKAVTTYNEKYVYPIDQSATENQEFGVEDLNLAD